MKKSSAPPTQGSPHTAPACPALLREANARGLLRLLRAHTPCTRAELARLSGLGSPAVTASVAQLQAAGVVRSLQAGLSQSGRKSERLSFVPTAGFVAGVDIGGTRIRLRVADLAGNEAGAWSTLLGRQEKTPEAVCRQIDEGLKECCRAAGILRRKLLHLTAGAPGITDSAAGIVLAAPNLSRWNQVPLRDLLERQTGLPVAVENDTNLAALGEHHCGAAVGIPSFVFLALGTGLGSGLVLGGKLYAGAHWSAGEVGYFGLRGQPREIPRLRETGQMERIVGGAGMERRWQQALTQRGLATPTLIKLRAGKILDRAQTGDPVARDILHDTATLLADAITDVSLVLDPELVVLGGGVGSHPALRDATEACLAANELARPLLRSSALGAAAQLAGAVALSIEHAERRLLA